LGFSSKDGVLANWGGYTTSDPGLIPGAKDAAKMNIWAFKLGVQNVGISEHRLQCAASLTGPSLISAMPNPFKASLSLALSGPLSRGAVLQIFDISGKQVADLSSKTKAGQVRWNAAGQPAGVYIVKARKGGLSLIKRIILAD
jgi:hypothetical protein